MNNVTEKGQELITQHSCITYKLQIAYTGQHIAYVRNVSKGSDLSLRGLFSLLSLQIHETLSHFITPAKDVYFSFHIGVGFGDCTVMQVGGLLGRFEYCATGPAFPQIGIAEPLAVSTETCASPEFLEVYENACTKIGVFHQKNTKTDTKGYHIMGAIEEFKKYKPKEEDLWSPPGRGGNLGGLVFHDHQLPALHYGREHRRCSRP